MRQCGLAARPVETTRRQVGGLRSAKENALLKAGNKNDRIDARKLADLLRSGLLWPVYHGGAGGVRTLKELAAAT